MELRAYFRIIRRRWVILLTLPLIALVAVILLDRTRSTQYTAESRVSISRLSEESTTTEYEFDDYYDFLATEFIIDDTVEIVRGNVFASAVADRMVAQGIAASADEVADALDASREHRILTILATTEDDGRSVIMANIASTEIRENFRNYLGMEDDPLPVTMRPVEVPTASEPDTLRVRLTYLIALVVASGLGLLFALGFEYLDDRVVGDNPEHEVGMPLLGVVHEDPAT